MVAELAQMPTAAHMAWYEITQKPLTVVGLRAGGWDLNSGPLEEQSVLLTTEPTPQPLQIALFF